MFFKKKSPKEYNYVVETYQKLLSHDANEELKFKFEYVRTRNNWDIYHLKCFIDNEWILIYQSEQITDDWSITPEEYYFVPFEGSCNIISEPECRKYILRDRSGFSNIFSDKPLVDELVKYYRRLITKYETFNHIKNKIILTQKEIIL